ncbi:MAG: pilus assembly protein [Proteobacteria bacterium]|nr:pilus assembly protein [Pseudomonadota bacterium]
MSEFCVPAQAGELPARRDTRRRSGFARRFLRDRSGNIAVEFAFVGPVFFGLLFGILETGLLYLKATAIDAGVEEAKRVVMTGQVQAEGTPTLQFDKFKAAFCDQAGWIIPCGEVKFDVRAFTSFTGAAMPNPVAGGVFNSAGMQFNPGTPNQIVVIRAYYETTSLTAAIRNDVANLTNGNVLLAGSAAFKNEP